MGSQTSTTSNQAGAMSPEAQRMLSLLVGDASAAAGQMGNLGQLAAGQGLDPSQSDRQLVQESMDASGQVARMQMEQQMAAIMRQLEEAHIGRGIEGSSLEAVNNALVGQDFQRQLAMMTMQNQAQGAQALMNMPFQRAGVQLNANQMLLQRLVGAGQAVLPYDQMIRGLNQTTTQQKPFDWSPVAGMAARAGAAYATGGLSEGVTQAAKQD